MKRHQILIADDEPMTRSVLKEILGGADCEVVAEADDGAQAIKLCAHHKPDVVFLDINMPVINGFDALETLREVLPGLPVVMLSASSTLENVRLCAKHHVSAFVVKPFTSEKILHALKAALRKA